MGMYSLSTGKAVYRRNGAQQWLGLCPAKPKFWLSFKVGTKIAQDTGKEHISFSEQ